MVRAQACLMAQLRFSWKIMHIQMWVLIKYIFSFVTRSGESVMHTESSNDRSHSLLDFNLLLQMDRLSISVIDNRPQPFADSWRAGTVNTYR